MLKAKLIAFNINESIRPDLPGLEQLLETAASGQAISVEQMRSAGIALTKRALEPLAASPETATTFLRELIYSVIEPVLVLDSSNGGHFGSVTQIAFNPVDSNLLATAGTDGTVKVVDIQSQSVVQSYNRGLEPRGDSGAINLRGIQSVIWSPDGRYLIVENQVSDSTPTPNRTIIDTHTQEILFEGLDLIEDLDGRPPPQVVQRNEQHGLTAELYSYGELKLVETSSDDLIWSIRLFSLPIPDSAVLHNIHSPDSLLLLRITRTNERGSSPYCCNAQLITRDEAAIRSVPVKEPSLVMWSPDSGHAVVAEKDGETWLLSIADEPFCLAGIEEGTTFTTGAFRNDFRFLALSGADETIGIFNLIDLRLAFTLDQNNGGHAARVNSVAFSPDKKQLVSADETGVIKVFNFDNILDAIIGKKDA
ncbi:MAG: hypothetical protein HQ596_01885 [Candidatus Saganbacteria bacterium]|nr:hypothetical protein [Candidatus Saganbacteria bacterium]